MPLAFNLPSGIIESIGGPEHSAEVQSFLDLVAEVERDNSADDSDDYYLIVNVDLKFVRTPDSTAIRVKNVKNDSGAAKIELTEDQLTDKYPWDYKELVEQLKSRYPDFKQNERFHGIKRRCEGNSDLCFVRYLDHRNQRGGKKKLYNPAMLNHFDSHYTKI